MAYPPCNPELVPLSSANSPGALGILPHLPSTVSTGKSKVTNKKCALGTVLLKLTTDRHEALHNFFATAELLAFSTHSVYLLLTSNQMLGCYTYTSEIVTTVVLVIFFTIQLIAMTV